MFENLKKLGYEVTLKTIKENKNRMRIIELVEKSPLKISEISKELSLNYKTTWEHIKVLENFGIVELTQNESVAGKPISVKIKDKQFLKILSMKEEEMLKMLK